MIIESIITKTKKKLKLFTLIRMCHIYLLLYLNNQKPGRLFIIRFIKRDRFQTLRYIILYLGHILYKKKKQKKKETKNETKQKHNTPRIIKFNENQVHYIRTEL